MLRSEDRSKEKVGGRGGGQEEKEKKKAKRMAKAGMVKERVTRRSRT